MVYKNKRDVFHYILYITFTIIVLISSISVIIGDTRVISKIATIILFGLIESYLTTIMFFTSFYFTRDKLICKLGTIELGYPYVNIKEIKESKSVSLFINSSFKCIKISNTDSRTIRISPENQQDFLDEMKTHGFILLPKKVKKESDKK